jgi:threonylcarbamoyladenosine tRNA methylthiotransferase MtaB
MESPRMGRTEQFTEVCFASDRPEGAIVAAPIAGHDGRRLKAG